jgi:hypothetical protein
VIESQDHLVQDGLARTVVQAAELLLDVGQEPLGHHVGNGIELPLGLAPLDVVREPGRDQLDKVRGRCLPRRSASHPAAGEETRHGLSDTQCCHLDGHGVQYGCNTPLNAGYCPVCA